MERSARETWSIQIQGQVFVSDDTLIVTDFNTDQLVSGLTIFALDGLWLNGIRDGVCTLQIIAPSEKYRFS